MSTLHITNGDCAAGTLRSFLADPVLVTCDVLHEGPAPSVDGDAWHNVRARFLAGSLEARYEQTRVELAAFDRAVTRCDRYDEIVLWFEHDLFDQLLLIRTLDLIGGPEGSARPVNAANEAGATIARVSLICIGEFPGVDRFVGLGQLNAEQLAALYPTRTRVTAAHVALAREAWQAFRADDPHELLGLMVRLTPDSAVASSTLPFLHGAIHRLFEEYPSTTNGLSRSANTIVRALAPGPLEAGALFPATQVDEARPFMGDLGFFQIVSALASARVPLVTVAPDPPTLDLRGHSVSVTDAGRRVLTGHADAVALNGIDEWRGGVHLAGIDRSPWRWNPDRETLVS